VKSQSRKKTFKRPPEARRPLYRHRIELPQTKGRMVKMIELIADSDYQCVSIHFQDNTDLEVMIDPALAFKASLYDWKTGKQRLLRRWPTVRSVSI